MALFRVRRWCFTLIEILIVITILILVTGVIGINVRRAFIEQRFRTELDLLVDTMRLAQDLMLILDVNVELKIRKSEQYEGIEYWLEVDGGVPKNWEPTLKRSHRVLQEIHFIDFAEERLYLFEPGVISIRFITGGTMMSRGVLSVSSHERGNVAGALTRAIILRGYPHPIESIPYDFSRQIDLSEYEDFNADQRLTSYTAEEVLEDVPPKKEENPSGSSTEQQDNKDTKNSETSAQS